METQSFVQTLLTDAFGEYLMTHPWFFLLIIWAAVWKGTKDCFHQKGITNIECC